MSDEERASAQQGGRLCAQRLLLIYLVKVLRAVLPEEACSAAIGEISLTCS